MMKALVTLTTIACMMAGALLVHAQSRQWHVVDNGGGRSTAGGFTLRASIGQSVVQSMSAVGARVETGYISGIRFGGGTTSVLDVINEPGWNLLSVPFILNDFRKSVIYPAGTSAAFSYAGSYQPKDTLKIGAAYWLKFPYAASVHFLGTAVLRETILVNNNWNLIGAASYRSLISEITPLDSTTFVSHFYGYRSAGGYYVEDTLEPGKGYWIKIHNAGKVLMKTQAGVTAPTVASRNRKQKEADGTTTRKNDNTLTIRDARGGERLLFFTSNLKQNELESWEMPPKMEGTMDVRYSSGRMMESGEPSNAKETGIVISSAEYPVTLSWKVDKESGGASLRIDGTEIPATGNGETHIANPEAHIILVLAASPERELPKTFALYQNYPNPFNPTTTIRYDLPQQSHVKIVIYDEIGREVKALFAGDQEAGYQSMTWNSTNSAGNSVASGMYFYRIEAGSSTEKRKTFVGVKKMLLIR